MQAPFTTSDLVARAREHACDLAAPLWVSGTTVHVLRSCAGRSSIARDVVLADLACGRQDDPASALTPCLVCLEHSPALVGASHAGLPDERLHTALDLARAETHLLRVDASTFPGSSSAALATAARLVLDARLATARPGAQAASTLAWARDLSGRAQHLRDDVLAALTPGQRGALVVKAAKALAPRRLPGRSGARAPSRSAIVLGELRSKARPDLGPTPLDDAVALVLLDEGRLGPGLLLAPAPAWALLEARSPGWVGATQALRGSDDLAVLEVAAALRRDGRPLAECLEAARALA